MLDDKCRVIERGYIRNDGQIRHMSVWAVSAPQLGYRNAAASDQCPHDGWRVMAEDQDVIARNIPGIGNKRRTWAVLNFGAGNGGYTGGCCGFCAKVHRLLL